MTRSADAWVFGPDGCRLGVVSASTRTAIADAAREMGGVQALVALPDGSREGWTMADVGGPWRRAWRRDATVLARGCAQPPADGADGRKGGDEGRAPQAGAGRRE